MRKKTTTGPQEKLMPGTIALVRGLMAAGATQKMLGYMSESITNFAIAATLASMYRLQVTRSNTPGTEDFWPLLLGWELGAAKKEYCGRPSYVMQGDNFPWAQMLTHEQKASEPARCSVVVNRTVHHNTFFKFVQEATQFSMRSEEVFLHAPTSKSKELCFSLQHGFEIIERLYLGVEGLKLRRAGMVPEGSMSPGQSLIVPVYFAEFVRDTTGKSTEYNEVPRRGLLIARAPSAEHADKTRAHGVIELRYVPFEQELRHPIHKGAVVCLNNLVWEKPQ